MTISPQQKDRICKTAWFYLSDAVASAAGLRLDELQQLCAGVRKDLTDAQWWAPARRMHVSLEPAS